MTKVQNPIIGRAKGSAGGMTFSKTYDKNVMRAKAFEVSNPNTQAQQTQRGFFSELQAVISQFTVEQLRTLFPSKPKAMSRRNALSKQIAEHSTTSGTTKSIDFEEIFTIGNAPTMDFGTTTCVFGTNVINVTIDNLVKNNVSIADFDFIAAVVNETKGEICLTTTCAAVSVGTIAIPTPSGWDTTDTIHAIPLITKSKDGKIALDGFGTIATTARPAKPSSNVGPTPTPPEPEIEFPTDFTLDTSELEDEAPMSITFNAEMPEGVDDVYLQGVENGLWQDVSTKLTSEDNETYTGTCITDVSLIEGYRARFTYDGEDHYIVKS